jgi:hypothetical protein
MRALALTMNDLAANYDKLADKAAAEAKAQSSE